MSDIPTLVRGAQLAEGKTKIVYAHADDPTLAIIAHKDGITAGDGARRNVIAGKGALSGRTAANVFALLARAGIATHFIAAPDATTMIVRRCAMLPLEVVMRRLATGSYLKRHPQTVEGARFEPPLVEFFLKDDARHDPQITPDEIAAHSIASAAEVAWMTDEGRRVFVVLEQAWAAQDITLVDLKIEFGKVEPRDGRLETESAPKQSPVARLQAPLIVADVIDNDAWRIWPGGDKTRMLDKQVYRNMAQVTEDGLDQIKQRYETVAAMTDTWRDQGSGSTSSF